MESLIDAGCCLIRPYRASDREAVVHLANNWHVARNMRNRFPHPYSHADADAWLAFLGTQNPLTNFAIEVGGEYAGGIGLTLESDVFYRCAEIGYWLGEPFWGGGIATAAVRAFTKFAFDNFDLLRIFANVFAWNPASGRVLEKAGYVREGVMRQCVCKLGEVTDAFLYAITRDMINS